MDIFSVFGISATGMDYQMLRLETIASNIANASTVRGADGTLYQPMQVVARSGSVNFDDMLDIEDRLPLNGIEQMTLEPVSDPVRLVHNPAHPYANADGFVEMPNINPVTEMTSLLEATRAYEANVRVMNAAKLLAAKAMEIGQ